MRECDKNEMNEILVTVKYRYTWESYITFYQKIFSFCIFHVGIFIKDQKRKVSYLKKVF